MNSATPTPSSSTAVSPSALIDKCGSCKRALLMDITAEMIPHMECQVCTIGPEEGAPRLRLCLACFINPDKHSSDHPYVVVRDSDTLLSPVTFPPSAAYNARPLAWTQRQDLALLNGVARLGYGNWEEIAEVALKQSHTKEECKHRFEQFRRGVTGEPPFLGTEGEDRSAMDAKLRERQDRLATMPGATLLGYTPLREEFDYVYANEAEALIADMNFGPEDEDDQERGPAWNELKLKVLRNYNLKLDVREARRKFVLERGLLDFARLQDLRRRLSVTPSGPQGPQQLIQHELEALSRFMSAQEAEQFRKGIARERLLRDEIKKLQQYRAIGLRTFDEVEAYSKQAVRRNQIIQQAQQQQQQLRQQASSSSSSIPTEENDGQVHIHKKPRLDNEENGVVPVFDVETDPALPLLNQQEVVLCRQLKLRPSHYFVIKEAVIKEAAKNGGAVSKPDTIAVLTVEMTVVDTLLDFFIKCDWVKRGAATASEKSVPQAAVTSTGTVPVG